MKYLLSLILFTYAFGIYANDKLIIAYLFDAESKEPLPFANINVEGKNKGAVTNADGKFVLDLGGIVPSDIVVFSCIGYETLKLKLSELKNKTKIYLRPSITVLRTVEVLPKRLSAEDIVALVRKNYKKNYPGQSTEQNVYFHKYEKVPFPKTNQIILKSSDFVGLERETFDELIKSLPQEFTEYQDALIDLYYHKGNYKIIPVQGISLEEGSNKALFDEMENKLAVLFDDIQKTNQEKDVYYKFQTGILGHKIKKKSSSESMWNEYKNDKLNNTLETEEVKKGILFLLNDYANIESRNWEFINKSSKYSYIKEEITSLNNEPVYAISFKPKYGGLFEGKMYVSTISYAVLQLDFAFAEGKRSQQFNAFGFGHSMNFVKGRVIFEKTKTGYFVKYIHAQQRESASIDREFTISKKQKRFLQDKELNEIKVQAKLSFKTKSEWELLVRERKEINPQQFDKVQQPQVMKFKIEYADNSGAWNKRTEIAPLAELKKYKIK